MSAEKELNEALHNINKNLIVNKMVAEDVG